MRVGRCSQGAAVEGRDGYILAQAQAADPGGLVVWGPVQRWMVMYRWRDGEAGGPHPSLLFHLLKFLVKLEPNRKLDIKAECRAAAKHASIST